MKTYEHTSQQHAGENEWFFASTLTSVQDESITDTDGTYMLTRHMKTYEHTAQQQQHARENECCLCHYAYQRPGRTHYRHTRHIHAHTTYENIRTHGTTTCQRKWMILCFYTYQRPGRIHYRHRWQQRRGAGQWHTDQGNARAGCYPARGVMQEDAVLV